VLAPDPFAFRPMTGMASSTANVGAPDFSNIPPWARSVGSRTFLSKIESLLEKLRIGEGQGKERLEREWTLCSSLTQCEERQSN
jgi:hypothetical protein